VCNLVSSKLDPTGTTPVTQATIIRHNHSLIGIRYTAFRPARGAVSYILSIDLRTGGYAVVTVDQDSVEDSGAFLREVMEALIDMDSRRE